MHKNSINKPVIKKTWKDIDQLMNKMQNMVQNLDTHVTKRSTKNKCFLLGVPNNGLIPSVYLSKLLKNKIHPKTLDHFMWNNLLTTDLRNNLHLIIDDIIDSGETMDRILFYLPNAKCLTLYGTPEGIKKLTDKYPNRVYAMEEVNFWIQFPWEPDGDEK